MLQKNKMVIESLYTSICDIFYKEEIKKANGSTKFQEIKKYSEIPCRVSINGVNKANQTSTTSNIGQEIKLFINNEIEIKEGSKIIVFNTITKRTNTYIASGTPAVRSVYQEVVLELEEQFA